jgi:hypothetical protein
MFARGRDRKLNQEIAIAAGRYHAGQRLTLAAFLLLVLLPPPRAFAILRRRVFDYLLL